MQPEPPVVVDVTSKAHSVMPEHDGRHAWIVAAVFRVTNPARSEHLLDRENVLTVEGPGCWHCEAIWRPDIGSKCPGEPKDPS